MSKMKESYEKISKERNERVQKLINEGSSVNEKSNEITNETSNENGKENLINQEQLPGVSESDKLKNEKARRNLFELKNLNKQELEKRRIEDMLLTAKDNRDITSDKNQTLNIPLDYKLNQNYPNPFNPFTNLEFQIPKSGFVSL